MQRDGRRHLGTPSQVEALGDDRGRLERLRTRLYHSVAPGARWLTVKAASLRSLVSTFDASSTNVTFSLQFLFVEVTVGTVIIKVASPGAMRCSCSPTNFQPTPPSSDR